jgi:NAD(P)-dependent dehydrogenase (short-subunit alcohol dehydrogenase family)
MATSKIVLCTGANQGLGLGVLQVAGLRHPDYTYILGSRDVAKGREAAQKLKDAGVTAQVEVLELDVTKDDQIAKAAQHIEETYGKLDGEHHTSPFIAPTFSLVPPLFYLFQFSPLSPIRYIPSPAPQRRGHTKSRVVSAA